VKVEVDPIMDKMRHSFVMIRTTDPNHYDLKDPLWRGKIKFWWTEAVMRTSFLPI